MYEFANGPIAEGLEIDHLCRVRHCVNPDHLEAVESKVNTRRGKRAKLTLVQVATIRSSPLSDGELARIYGVHRTAIGKIRRRVTWAD